MANEFQFDHRSEGNPPKNPQWSKQPSSGESASDPIETTDTSNMMESPESFSFEMESSPIVESFQPAPKTATPPTPPKVSSYVPPKQQQSFEYVEYEEKSVEIDQIWFTPHPYHHCMTICEYVKDCMLHCERTLNILMSQPDAPRRRRQLALLQDCIEVCLFTTRVIARKSPIMKTALLYCAKVCRLCAQESGKYRDPISMESQKMCLHCAQVCEQFANKYQWV